MPGDLSFSFTSPSEKQSNLVMEYGESWAAGDKNSRAYTLKGRKKRGYCLSADRLHLPPQEATVDR